MFYHWIRSDVDKQLVDYPYAKFNKKLDINEATKRYTDQEYAKHLRDDDWSKAETDRLFDLIFAFDMRWHVVYDRLSYLLCHNGQKYRGINRVRFFVHLSRYNESKPRTLEQLKSRFYDVAAKLSRTRSSTPQSAKTARLYQFDAEVSFFESNVHGGSVVLSMFDVNTQYETKRKTILNRQFLRTLVTLVNN